MAGIYSLIVQAGFLPDCGKFDLTNFLPDSERSFCNENDLPNEGRTVPLSDGQLFDVYFVDLKQTELEIFHQNEKGEKFKSIKNLKSYLQGKSKKLLFATNGGMFKKDLSPTGLYVENGKTRFPLNTDKNLGGGYSNFYSIYPNGVFYVKKNKEFGIVKREEYHTAEEVEFATQSGPMLMIDGEINTNFNKNSKSKFIRNGVGITSRGRMMFAISHEPVTLFDFSRIFKYYGCDRALYLDGYVSEMYLPELKRIVTSNEFALIIGVTEK